MYRKAQEKLKKWLLQGMGRKPLIIRGARQVGKSTLVRQLSENNQLDLCEINLEKHPELEKVFRSLDVKKIIAEIQAILQKKIQENSLLFLDEIQATPTALAALRYFYEEMPQLPVIAAGSLLDFALEEAQYSVPVGRVEYYHLGPFDFEEFLAAKQETYLLDLIQNITLTESLTSADHRRLIDLTKDFFFTGGMPEAVAKNASGGLDLNLQSVHRSLIETYSDDFNKYARKQDIPLLHEIYKKIPNQVGKKIKYVDLAIDEKSREVKRALQLLIKAKLVTPVFHSNCSGIPLESQRNLGVFKLLHLDVGLLNSSLRLEKKDIMLLTNEDLLTSGAQAEQFVGQHLLYQKHNSEPNLHYWLREQQSRHAEIDYVIQIGTKILPIEVKAGPSGKLKSLHQFMVAKNADQALRLNMDHHSSFEVKHSVKIGNDSKKIQFQLISLPLYLVGQIDRLIR